MRCAAESFVHVIVAPCALGDALGLAAHRDRQRDARAGMRLADELDEREQRLIGGERVALVVDDRRGLAVGVEDEAEVGARGAHEVADRS